VARSNGRAQTRNRCRARCHIRAPAAERPRVLTEERLFGSAPGRRGLGAARFTCSGRVRICDLDSVDLGPWRQRVRPRPHAAGDLAHCDPSDDKGIRDERAMAAPRNGLRAHQHDMPTGGSSTPERSKSRIAASAASPAGEHGLSKSCPKTSYWNESTSSINQ
jgi:hypothetical protein